jgi:hypothetical protein
LLQRVADSLIDALNELSDAPLEAEKLGIALKEVRETPHSLEGAMGWLTGQGLASAIEKIDAGCERAMAIVTKSVDGQAIEAGDGWHRSLILRMANPFGTRRPAAFSAETVAELNKMRPFRHRERNSYGSALKAERVIDIAADAVVVPALMASELKLLATFLEGKKSTK